MPELNVIPVIRDGQLAPYMTPGQEMATVEVVGCLPGGMASGLPSFVVVIALPDGKRVIAETSWRNMALAFAACAGVWGMP